jgi:5-methylcytosine-specific restriction enzyme subunit McrC
MTELAPIEERRIIRLCESGKPIRHGLDLEQKAGLEAAVDGWMAENPTGQRPLSFSGAHGELLLARQFAGIVGTYQATVEIYPKLDASVIHGEVEVGLPVANTVLQNLLWMMEAAAETEPSESGIAGLPESPTNFFDVYAFLMARSLQRELELGVPHEYIRQEDDLRMVRGRLDLLPQITRNWNRWDRLRCIWDEFTPDNALLRLLKCACRLLISRVSNPRAVQLLENCVGLLSEAIDTDVRSALAGVQNLRWDRRLDRFRRPFDLARRLLQGTGQALVTGDVDTFVFLVDMHQLFEDYAHAVLEFSFGVSVQRQVTVGKLFKTPIGGMNQIADYRWQAASDVKWIGDAKYKHLGRQGQPFEGLAEADVRQVTVYAELDRQRSGSDLPPSLMVLYPFVGSLAEFTDHQATAWNGSDFWLVPVDVRRKKSLIECVPGNLVAMYQ